MDISLIFILHFLKSKNTTTDYFSINAYYWNKILNKSFKKFSYLEIPLDAGDFSLMDRKVVDAINNTSETDRFIRGLRAWVGFKQIGVPYKRDLRKYGKTTYKTKSC